MIMGLKGCLIVNAGGSGKYEQERTSFYFDKNLFNHNSFYMYENSFVKATTNMTPCTGIMQK